MVLTDLETITGLAVIIALVVQLVKRWLVDDDILRLVAVGIGIVLAVAAAVVLRPVTPVAIANAMLSGFLGGCSAIGLYQVQKPIALLARRGDVTARTGDGQ